MAADGFRQERLGHPLIPLCQQENVNGLARLIHRAIEGVPLAVDPDRGLIPTPADPDRARAAVERCCVRRALWQDPAVDGRVVDRHLAFLHPFFHLAIAQGIDDVPPPTGQNHVFHTRDPGEVQARFKINLADHVVRPVSLASGG
jgi:hypothetical protein